MSVKLDSPSVRTQTVAASPGQLSNTAQGSQVKKKIRCDVCNIKTGINYFECKCKRLFCAKHRLTFDHSCTYDHAADAKKLLVKNNPRVVTQKIDKI